MKPRIFLLPLAAVVIAALVTWRYQREARRTPGSSTGEPRQLAPRFELYDQHSRLVKFERYLGRTELLVVFLEKDVPADEHPLLVRLRDEYERLAATGLEVVAVSLATPHAIREAERRSGVDFPFPVLTDIDPVAPIPAPAHRLWGLTDDQSAEIRPGAFHVDRRGHVASRGGVPRPLDDPVGFIADRLTETSSS